MNDLGTSTFYDGKCKERCDMSSDCTGYSQEDDGWCETYASIWICGDGEEGFTCYTKQMGTSFFYLLKLVANINEI